MKDDYEDIQEMGSFIQQSVYQTKSKEENMKDIENKSFAISNFE